MAGLFDFETMVDLNTFEGPNAEQHTQRLRGQIKRVFELMKDGRWRSLGQIESETGDPQASVSAQLRHLRKPRFGGYTVLKKHEGNGLYLYRLVI